MEVDQPGRFRVRFTAKDSEENADRREYEILVQEEQAPLVVLTHPGKNVSIPANGVMDIEGRAASDIGIKRLALQLRIASGPKAALEPKVYRPDKNLQADDGSYPDVIEYVEILALDDLKLPAGTVLEYWLEAADNADYPHVNGNLGKSSSFQICSRALTNDAAAAAKRAALKKQEERNKKQDNKPKNEANPKNGPGDSPHSDQNPSKQENDKTKQKLDDAKGPPDNKPGGAKDGSPQNADAKGSPSDKADGQQPQEKPQPQDGGDKKDQGGGQGGTGEAKDGGAEPKADSKGDRKDGPKDAAGGAKGDGPMGKPDPQMKDGPPMGMDTPSQAKEKGGDAGGPIPQVKQDAQPDPLAKGESKGIEQNGPDAGSKDQQNAGNPPDLPAKGSKTSDDAERKPAPPTQANQAGKTRDDDTAKDQKRPPLDDLLKALPKLAQHDKEGNEAGEMVAKIGKATDDPATAELAKNMLAMNGRDPSTGLEKKKGPNQTGSGGKSEGISDEIKAAAANREFARRIGQMQFDDWKNGITADLLKKVGMSDADWQAAFSQERAIF